MLCMYLWHLTYALKRLRCYIEKLDSEVNYERQGNPTFCFECYWSTITLWQVKSDEEIWHKLNQFQNLCNTGKTHFLNLLWTVMQQFVFSVYLAYTRQPLHEYGTFLGTFYLSCLPSPVIACNLQNEKLSHSFTLTASGLSVALQHLRPCQCKKKKNIMMKSFTPTSYKRPPLLFEQPSHHVISVWLGKAEWNQFVLFTSKYLHIIQLTPQNCTYHENKQIDHIRKKTT